MDKKTLAVVIGGLTVSVGLVVFALWPYDHPVTDSEIPGMSEVAVRSSNDGSFARPEPTLSGGEDSAVVISASSNVYVRLPDGGLSRPGERLPAVVPESDESRQEAVAQAEWDRLVAEYSKPVGREMDGRDIRRFSDALQRLPRAKRLESLKAAENLLPAENLSLVMSLALDRTLPVEIIAEGFDACLNNPGARANAVIAAVAGDKSHPNFVDAARIVDIRRLSE